MPRPSGTACAAEARRAGAGRPGRHHHGTACPGRATEARTGTRNGARRLPRPARRLARGSPASAARAAGRRRFRTDAARADAPRALCPAVRSSAIRSSGPPPFPGVPLIAPFLLDQAGRDRIDGGGGHGRSAATAPDGRESNAARIGGEFRLRFPPAPTKPTGKARIAAGFGQPSSRHPSKWKSAVGALPMTTTAPSRRWCQSSTAARRARRSLAQGEARYALVVQRADDVGSRQPGADDARGDHVRVAQDRLAGLQVRRGRASPRRRRPRNRRSGRP